MVEPLLQLAAEVERESLQRQLVGVLLLLFDVSFLLVLLRPAIRVQHLRSVAVAVVPLLLLAVVIAILGLPGPGDSV